MLLLAIRFLGFLYVTLIGGGLRLARKKAWSVYHQILTFSDQLATEGSSIMLCFLDVASKFDELSMVEGTYARLCHCGTHLMLQQSSL